MPTDDDSQAPPERVRSLHVVATSGDAFGDEWVVHCSTCGWEIRGSGDTDRRNAEAAGHSCPPVP